MVISYEPNGSTVLTASGAPGEPDRVLTIPAGTDPAERQRQINAFIGPAPAEAAPDGPTLSDWRVALTLWGRLDDVTARIAALRGSSDPQTAMMGRIATERFEYANNVLRAQLLTQKDVLGFSEGDVEESLWRAARVAKGDLSSI